MTPDDFMRKIPADLADHNLDPASVGALFQDFFDNKEIPQHQLNAVLQGANVTDAVAFAMLMGRAIEIRERLHEAPDVVGSQGDLNSPKVDDSRRLFDALDLPTVELDFSIPSNQALNALLKSITRTAGTAAAGEMGELVDAYLRLAGWIWPAADQPSTDENGD